MQNTAFEFFKRHDIKNREQLRSLKVETPYNQVIMEGFLIEYKEELKKLPEYKSKIPKILYYDIETTGFGADFAEMLMFSYCWEENPEEIKNISVLDYPESFDLPPEKRDLYIIPKIIELLNQADYVVAHYGSKFDNRFVQTRAEMLGLDTADIKWSKTFDTCITARKNLKFQSNRLANIAEALGLDAKGSLPKYIWRRANCYDKDAIAQMVDYCTQDVKVLYQIAQRLRKYTKHLPSWQVMTGEEDKCCYACGGGLIQKGFSHTKSNKYARYQCKGCGAWQRGKVALNDSDKNKEVMY